MEHGWGCAGNEDVQVIIDHYRGRRCSIYALAVAGP